MFHSANLEVTCPHFQRFIMIYGFPYKTEFHDEVVNKILLANKNKKDEEENIFNVNLKIAKRYAIPADFLKVKLEESRHKFLCNVSYCVFTY